MKPEHGTIQSYVIGFALSLIFTLVPYFLAVNQIITGLALFSTIITFALLQMVIQVVFFLHLGRERKPRWQAGFLVATAGAIFVVTVATSWILYHLHTNMTPTAEALRTIEDEGIAQIGTQQTGACQGAYVLHKVTIENGIVSPSHTDARKCDRLEFTNADGSLRTIVFGPKDHLETYGGEESLSLPQGLGQTLILNQMGTHTFHDNLHEPTAGDFTVTP
jgi:cytochrome o ubiquinol oxidase subunit IV